MAISPFRICHAVSPFISHHPTQRNSVCHRGTPPIWPADVAAPPLAEILMRISVSRNSPFRNRFRSMASPFLVCREQMAVSHTRVAVRVLDGVTSNPSSIALSDQSRDGVPRTSH